MDKRSLGIGVSDIFSNRLFTSDEIEVKTRLTSFIPSLHNNLTAQREIEKLQTGRWSLFFIFSLSRYKENNKVVGVSIDCFRESPKGRFCHPFIPSFNQLGLMLNLIFMGVDKAIKAAERFIVVNPNIID